ncbi:cyclic nucleotide-binding domain-containing protein [Algoriphagus aquimarinus]|nr:Crp/Fnr family transcriptional regulator [Algoriphagus aquimarinus]
MKEDCDPLVPDLILDYTKVDLFLNLRKGKKGEVLKDTSSVETCSRYICEGFIGLFYDSEKGPVLSEIFQATDVAFDFHSYLTGERTQDYIKCLSDVVYYELSKKSEMTLIQNHPDFAKLGFQINHRMLKRLYQRSRIKAMGITKGYKQFVEYLPGIELHLSQSKIASYFFCSERSVREVQHALKPGK